MNRSPSAWRGPELAAREDEWIHRLTADEVAELEDAHAQWRARGAGTMETMTRLDFPLPRFGRVLAALGEEIESGRGFGFLRGLPVGRWGVEASRDIYWGLANHLGAPVRQNARAERLVKVRDEGGAEKATSRAPQSRSNLNFHSDFCEVVGLLCINAAKSGGVSRICSTHAILERMEAEHPEYLPVFEQGFHFFRKGEEAVGEPPVSARRLPMLDRSGKLPMFLYWPGFATQGAHFSGVPLTQLEKDALSFVNRVACDASYHLDTHFQPGDVQFLNNYRITHSRTEFEDWPEPERQRYLERIWLRTSEPRNLPPGFTDLHGPNSLLEGFPIVPPELVAERELALQALSQRLAAGAAPQMYLGSSGPLEISGSPAAGR
ncbi:TauD/TfdA family dioxygenase [Ramlibacter sp.]|uniref:TauD/TfdA family dioxygenase n=1 Tax=Ramlibacter sp. TaxID=1917967 RepID=UPI003D097C23